MSTFENLLLSAVCYHTSFALAKEGASDYHVNTFMALALIFAFGGTITFTKLIFQL